jgi:hypothetical protein
MTAIARTRLILVTASVVVLVALVGGAIAASSGDPDAPVGSGPIGGPAPSDDGPIVVTPRPGMADVFARPFDTATVSDDGRSVAIDFVSGVEPCSVLDHVDVRARPDAVSITVFEGHDPDAGDVACIEIGVLKRTVVQLDEPVGGRTIVDGAA